MSKPVAPNSTEDAQQEPAGKGPNLVLLYSLLGLAMVAALAIAALIVLPFYHRR
jgi:hypothetical protein